MVAVSFSFLTVMSVSQLFVHEQLVTQLVPYYTHMFRINSPLSYQLTQVNVACSSATTRSSLDERHLLRDTCGLGAIYMMQPRR